MLLISACLLGIPCKYDGNHNENALLQKYSKLCKYIPVCPEELGDLSTPRPPVELGGGTGREVLEGQARAFNSRGEDVTQPFIQGARQVLFLAGQFPVKAAILKERSPSCGVHFIYDGTFSHTVIEGMGVTAALLHEHGIPVFSEEDLTEELLTDLLKSESQEE